VSVTGALATLTAALEAAGVRVAIRDGDITPPVAYVRIGAVSDLGAPLDGDTVTTFWVHYIPVRGVDNLAGDADALDRIYAALSPLTTAELATAASSVTAKGEPWPCYRLDVPLWAEKGSPLNANDR
jgi:hypothetical protein